METWFNVLLGVGAVIVFVSFALVNRALSRRPTPPNYEPRKDDD